MVNVNLNSLQLLANTEREVEFSSMMYGRYLIVKCNDYAVNVYRLERYIIFDTNGNTVIRIPNNIVPTILLADVHNLIVYGRKINTWDNRELKIISNYSEKETDEGVIMNIIKNNKIKPEKCVIYRSVYYFGSWTCNRV